MVEDVLARDASVGARPMTGGFKVDISRGERIGRVSSEWFSRPDDERYLSLSALHDAVRNRAARATARTVETRDIRVEAKVNDVSRLALAIPGRDAPVMPTHWSFGQLSALSAHRRAICAIFPRRWQGSISSTGWRRTARSWSRRSRRTTAGSNCAR